MSKEPIEYLKHIRDESAYILSVITQDKTKDDFLADETLKRAVRIFLPNLTPPKPEKLL